MKKIMIIMIFSLLTTGCFKEEKNNLVDVPIDTTPIETSDEYVDNNPVIVSIYKENETGALDKVIDKYVTKWEKKKDIVVLATLPTDIEHPEYDYMQNLWPKFDSEYEDVNYKIGWSLSFDLKNGENITSTILKPSDAAFYYDYLEVYLYDDVNVSIGQWHSHLLDDEINDNTIMDAIKLTAGENYDEITGPISLTVFSYDDLEDFDENGKYQGKSLYQVKIYNS